MTRTLQHRLERVAERLAGKRRRLVPEEMNAVDFARRVGFILYAADAGHRPDLLPLARKIAGMLTVGKGEAGNGVA